MVFTAPNAVGARSPAPKPGATPPPLGEKVSVRGAREKRHTAKSDTPFNAGIPGRDLRRELLTKYGLLTTDTAHPSSLPMFCFGFWAFVAARVESDQNIIS